MMLQSPTPRYYCLIVRKSTIAFPVVSNIPSFLASVPHLVHMFNNKALTVCLTKTTLGVALEPAIAKHFLTNS